MEPLKPSDPDYLPPTKGKTPEEMADWMAKNMPGKPEYLTCLCRACSQKLEFPVELFFQNFKCPTCGEVTRLFNREYGDLVTTEMGRRVEAYSRRVGCPNCGCLDYDLYEPARPVVFGSMTFTGQLLAGISNSMADAMFKPEKVCCKCGQHRPDF